MGMTASYRRISQSEFDSLLNDSGFAQRFLGLSFDENEEEAADKFWNQLRNSENYLDIGKAWHGLNFLLTGQPRFELGSPDEPLHQVVFGGKETEYDTGTAPIRYLGAEEVKEVAKALSNVSRIELQGRFNAQTFQEAKIYPPMTAAAWQDSEDDFLLDTFESVRDFFQSAAQSNQVVLLSIE